MTKLLITYDTVGADGVRGETCCEVEVSDTSANVSLLGADCADPHHMWVVHMLDVMLSYVEALKDRRYVMGSIKDIRPAANPTAAGNP